MNFILPLTYLGLSFILYSTSLFGDWLFDDHTGLLTDMRVKKGRWQECFTSQWLFKEHRWLLMLSYTLNSRFLGRIYGRTDKPDAPIEPTGFHIVNVIIHGLNASIVLYTLSALNLSQTQLIWAGLIFVSHPLAANSVAGISNRGSLLSGTFYFLSLGFALHRHPILAILMIPIAFSAKQDAAILVLLLGLIGLIQHSYLSFTLIGIIPLLIFGTRQAKWLKRYSGEENLVNSGFPPAEVKGLNYYRTIVTETILRLPQWSVGYNLQIDAEVHKSSLRRQISALILTIGFVAIWIEMLRYDPRLAILLLTIAISPLLIYWCVELPDLVSDHRAYACILGISGLFAYLAPWPILAVFWVYCCSITIHRSHAWTTPLRMWTQAYADGSRKLRVIVNLNYAYQHSGDFQQASLWAKRALDIQPQLLPVKMNVATALSAQGRTDEAIQVLNDAVQGTPLIWQAWKVLGSLYEQKSEWNLALGAYTRATDLHREDAELYNHMGAMRVKLNAWEQALQPFECAYKLNPDNPSYAYNIAMLHFRDGKRDLALEWFKRIPENATMPDELSQLLKTTEVVSGLPSAVVV